MGVEGNEDLDKDMWGEENGEDDEDKDIEKSEEKGNSPEGEMDDLVAKEDKEKSKEEKRKRKEEEKEKENEDQEFDDNQTDTQYGENKEIPEPEAFELPDTMELDEKDAEDNFEEGGNKEPETMPDFEEE